MYTLSVSTQTGLWKALLAHINGKTGAEAKVPDARPLQVNLHAAGDITLIDGKTGDTHILKQDQERIFPAGDFLATIQVSAASATDLYVTLFYADEKL